MLNKLRAFWHNLEQPHEPTVMPDSWDEYQHCTSCNQIVGHDRKVCPLCGEYTTQTVVARKVYTWDSPACLRLVSFEYELKHPAP